MTSIFTHGYKKVGGEAEIWEHACVPFFPFFLLILGKSFVDSEKNRIFALNNKIGDTIMALAIKAIPTLYGDEARRFRDMADETERKFDMRPKRDLTADPRYKAMRIILERSNINF